MELEAFPLDVPGQKYVVLSFVSPTAPQAAANGFRVYGAFATLELAREYAQKVNAVDDAFDVYVAEMYRWCPWHPDPQLIADKVHSDAQLDTLLREHRQQQETARVEFDKRIAEDLAKSAAERRKKEAETTEAEGAEGAEGAAETTEA
jgi:hypothetical protein